ncbi:MAG TPA: hypothetical protein VF779_03520 [Pyrinomonadaceae bacterium]
MAYAPEQVSLCVRHSFTFRFFIQPFARSIKLDAPARQDMRIVVEDYEVNST